MKSNESFIPYGKQNVTNDDIDAVVQILRGTYLTQGPVVQDFENAISNKVGANYSVATSSATSGLHLACLSLGLGKGDWLWTSPITFVASANCALYCGAKVDFVDINIKTGLMDIESLKRKLKIAENEGRLPKVVIPVHLAGSSCDMEEIAMLSRKYGFKIIEDASHAIGGKYKEKYVGNCKFSDITVFSFHPVKIITTGEGGICATNNSGLAEKMRDLRSHGIIKDSWRQKRKNMASWYYEQTSLGYNYRLTDIQAALGLSQLKRLDNIVEERNKLLEYYAEKLKGMPISTMNIPPAVKSAGHLSVILIGEHQKRDAIFEEMRKRNIGVQLHYFPVHMQPYYQKQGFKKGEFPNSELYGKSAMSIPLYPGLSDEKQDLVVENLKGLL
ncbi:UDP-4-amino-4/6-dideoxy-N-acetyl-beta-L-altrosamine transaminase [Synechococcus sp. BIOS-U3-1]|uniref:UDP-4-amino-4, 6-dideoxy-N-acetyl-beta-L-altrosamine transaminase n=1 Tax=Synechococcus sp. BIOS-U3-1 TaxID=1400865 RepID=UPI00164539D5|nr:UDP-4-amino-4,6-dideoxy-N-acetyl-beta-L-altrosamine transaminase [Synechococcus sp. BIOS-U3-1]QNI57178.1 UDP-4-amino-4/6-dideoxy-N-acetyl-beta-L-altrosamine transaminase [Synechococcus sp. BIOS-U3-1]